MVNEQSFGSGLATRLTCIPLPSTKFKTGDGRQSGESKSSYRKTGNIML